MKNMIMGPNIKCGYVFEYSESVTIGHHGPVDRTRNRKETPSRSGGGFLLPRSLMDSKKQGPKTFRARTNRL